jgi:hypothetical protein
MKLRIPLLGGLAALAALTAAPAMAHEGYGYGYGPGYGWRDGYHHHHHRYGERVVIIREAPVRRVWREETYRRTYHPLRRTAVHHTARPTRVIHTRVHRIVRRPVVREVIVVREPDHWGYRHHWRHEPRFGPRYAYGDYSWRHHRHHWRDE